MVGMGVTFNVESSHTHTYIYINNSRISYHHVSWMVLICTQYTELLLVCLWWGQYVPLSQQEKRFWKLSLELSMRDLGWRLKIRSSKQPKSQQLHYGQKKMMHIKVKCLNNLCMQPAACTPNVVEFSTYFQSLILFCWSLLVGSYWFLFWF